MEINDNTIAFVSGMGVGAALIYVWCVIHLYKATWLLWFKNAKIAAVSVYLAVTDWFTHPKEPIRQSEDLERAAKWWASLTAEERHTVLSIFLPREDVRHVSPEQIKIIFDQLSK